MTRKEQASISEERRLRRWQNRMDAALRSQNRRNRSTRAPCRSRSRAGCGIASTSGMSLSNRVLSAAASPAIPTTCALPRLARSDVRSAMSSPSLCAAGTIVKSTVMAMKLRGGARPLSIHSPPLGPCGLRRIRHSLHKQTMWLQMPSPRLPHTCRSARNRPERHGT